MNIASFPISSAYFSIDWILIGVLVVVIALDAMRSGSARAGSIAIAAPLALLLSGAVSQAAFIGSVVGQFSGASAQALLFGAIFIVTFLFVNRIVDSFSGSGGLVQATFAGIAATAVLLVVWLQVPGLQSLWHFGPQIQMIFGEAYRFWWLIVAYAALAVVRS